MSLPSNDHTNDALREPQRGEQPLPDDSDADLIVVSNDLPYQYVREDDEANISRPLGRSSGAMMTAVGRVGGRLIARSDGNTERRDNGDGRSVVVPHDDESDAESASARIRVDEVCVETDGDGYSDRVLRPICHCSLSNVRSRPGDWERYRTTNETFADAVVDRASAGDVVFTQDSQFGRLSRLVDERTSGEVFLAHFWEDPWPGWDTFRACPHAEAVLRGLLGNDLFGVQVPRFRANFLQCVDAALPDARIDWHDGRVFYRGGVTTVGTFPLGVDTDRVQRHATDPSADHRWSRFRTRSGLDTDTRVAVGVDSLDYTKGILERFDALERLLETRPEWRGELTLVQVGAESHSEASADQALRDEAASAVARLNERFGASGWQPVVYTTRHLSDGARYSLYRHADVGVVSPIRDGMNRVAQEFVAAQADDPGVLVLSDQGGTHDVLGEWAVSVSPQDTAGFASGLQSALSMPVAERRRRMASLARETRDLDVGNWIDDLFGRIVALRNERERGRTRV